MSVFRSQKKRNTLISFGQDEAIFKQFIHSSMSWTSDSGRKRLSPKDDGSGLMVSAFQSRELGFGANSVLDDELLRKVNKHRKKMCYYDKDAAWSARKIKRKEPIQNDPFVKI